MCSGMTTYPRTTKRYRPRICSRIERKRSRLRGAKKGQSLVAGTGDKVQVMRAVGAMQAARHDKQNSTGSIASRPCKERKDGAPTSRNGKEKKRERWATRHQAFQLVGPDVSYSRVFIQLRIFLYSSGPNPFIL